VGSFDRRNFLFSDFCRREKRVKSLPDLTARARYPSSLISQSHCEPSGRLTTDRHFIGSTTRRSWRAANPACWLRFVVYACLQQVEMGPFAHPPFITSAAQQSSFSAELYPSCQLSVVPEAVGRHQSHESLSHGGGTLIDAMPAAVAASIPISVSSNTKQDSVSTPSRAAAIRKASGSGFALL